MRGKGAGLKRTSDDSTVRFDAVDSCAARFTLDETASPHVSQVPAVRAYYDPLMSAT